MIFMTILIFLLKTLNMQDVSTPNPNMRIPKRHDSLSWGKGRRNRMSTEDATLVSSTLASLNKFSNDGSFMSEVTSQRSADSGAKRDRERKSDVVQIDSEKLSDAVVKPEMSANQIAAKVMQLRLKGKHEEADNLLVSNYFLLALCPTHMHIHNPLGYSHLYQYFKFSIFHVAYLVCQCVLYICLWTRCFKAGYVIYNSLKVSVVNMMLFHLVNVYYCFPGCHRKKQRK